MARTASSGSALGRTISALLPPSSSRLRPSRPATATATARPMRTEPVAEISGSAGDAARRAPTSPPPISRRGDAGRGLREVRQHLADEALAGGGAQRRLLRGLPHDGVAADQAEHRVPRPHRHREVERGDDADRAERVPLLHQAVAGPLAGDGQAVQLARQADGEVADVDPLLDLAQALARDLADLAGDQRAEVGALRAHPLADAPHQFAAARRRHRAPRGEGRRGGRDRAVGVGRAGHGEGREPRAVDRGARAERRPRGGVPGPADGEPAGQRGDAEAVEERVGHGCILHSAWIRGFDNLIGPPRRQDAKDWLPTLSRLRQLGRGRPVFPRGPWRLGALAVPSSPRLS